MRKSISNAVAGGLITSATVMGVDALHNPAAADVLEASQDFSFNFATVALTCCFDDTGGQDFVFDGFDTSLGDLNTVDLSISFLNLIFDPADVSVDGLIQITGEDGNTVTLDAAQFGGNLNTIDLVASQFLDNLNTVTLDFSMLFPQTPVFTNDENKGTATLSYSFTPAAVPLPASAVLMAPALAVLFAAGACRRRRPKEDF